MLTTSSNDPPHVCRHAHRNSHPTLAEVRSDGMDDPAVGAPDCHTIDTSGTGRGRFTCLGLSRRSRCCGGSHHTFSARGDLAHARITHLAGQLDLFCGFYRGSAITSTLVVGMPATFQQMFNLPNDAVLRGIMMGPGGQTLIDLVCLALLLVYRDCFRINRLLVKYQEDSPA